jgi:hypothetical protein
MHNLFEKLSDLQRLFEYQLSETGSIISDPVSEQFNFPGWANYTWTSTLYRKAHLNVIATNNLWMMHCCIYPHYHNPAPIFGFDVFAGKNKITGCFHDFSPVIPNHKLSEWFANASKLEWNKKRELPDWAKQIFSNDIIAAGNIQTDEEVAQIQTMIKNSLSTYLHVLPSTNLSVPDISNIHKFYIDNQRLNPHNPSILKSLGLSENHITTYINHCLFPY